MVQLNVTERISAWFSTMTIASREGISQATDSGKPPEWYLDGATKCTDRAHRMTSEISDSAKVKLYRRQCEYLAEKLETAIKNSRESFGRSFSPEHKVECLGALKLLYRLAKEVESIIQDCCKDEAWVRAAFTPASVPVRVSSLGCHLKLCTEGLRNSNKLGAAWLTFTKLEGLGEAELVAVKEMASEDDDTLMRLLESLTSLSSESLALFLEHDIEFATILLARLKAIQAMSNAGSLQSSNLQVWEVDGRQLQRSEMLGRSSWPTVYKAKWFGAVEVAENVFDGLDNPNFTNALAFLAGVSHPNIVSFLGFTRDKDHCSIVMELMDGDLRTLMQRKLQEDGNRNSPFSIWEACDIMLQVAEGVQYMHQNGVVHRDLKSLNILVSSKDDDPEHVCAKVCDFGNSKRKEKSRTYSNLTLNMGTTRWMAPELIGLRGGELSTTSEDVLKHPFKCDVYSFGMLCYEILTGDMPFSNIGNPGEVKREVLKGCRPELPSQCPQNVKNLIELCWDAQPMTRPSFSEICEELRYIGCSLLLEPFDQDCAHHPALPVPKALDLPEEVSKFKGEYSSLKVVRQLGKGGSDTVTVYLSTWSRTDDGAQVDVAQKRFMGSHNQCFVNEVSIMADLEHPNVVRLLYYATDRRSCSIVMELMDEDLHDLMHRKRLECNGTPAGPFSLADAVHVILQVARGMHHIHGKNVVHRDLKSCNILVRRAIEGGQLDVKVADFGLSRKLKSRRTFLDSGVGTVRWMAPEVMSVEDDADDVHAGASNYDPFKSDVYSFGMVCYEILAGKVPFFDVENLSEVKKRVLDGGRPGLPEWTPSNLKALVEKCWQKQASKRPSFAEIIEELTQSRMHTKSKTLIGRYYHEVV